MKTYSVVRLFGRPILAYNNCFSELDEAALNCYPAFTLKRRMFLRIILFIHRIIPRQILWGITTTPIKGVSPEVLVQLSAILLDKLQTNIGKLVIVWPNNPTRGRVYLFVLDRSGKSIAFGKLALNELNSKLLENEELAMSAVGLQNLQNLKIPKLICSGCLLEIRYLVVTPLPASARRDGEFGTRCFDRFITEYSGEIRLVSRLALGQLAWWNTLKESLASFPDISNYLELAVLNGAQVAFVHGDFNRTNFVRDGDEFWLIDWERSCHAGPYLVDFLCIAADQLWSISEVRPVVAVTRFKEVFWDNKPSDYRKDVLLGLAFLHAADFSPASILLTNGIWKIEPVDSDLETELVDIKE